jgi:hypothetical protein
VSEDNIGLYSRKYESSFLLTEEMILDQDSGPFFTVPLLTFYLPESFPDLERYPSLTLMLGLSRIGGLLSIIKLYSTVLYSAHQRLFERRLSRKENANGGEPQAKPPTILAEATVLETVKSEVSLGENSNNPKIQLLTRESEAQPLNHQTGGMAGTERGPVEVKDRYSFEEWAGLSDMLERQRGAVEKLRLERT